MRNHWHLVVWPKHYGQLSEFTGWLTLTRMQRWHAHRHNAGSRHFYQGRFKSFPVRNDEHFHTVYRYVERNALQADLVQTADAWRRGSLFRWRHGTPANQRILSTWPLPRKRSWLDYVNQPLTQRQYKALQRSLQRGRPFGDENRASGKIKGQGLKPPVHHSGS